MRAPGGRVRPDSEAGQSIVLITLVFVGLLAFIALAVDAGFAFARSSSFSRAVDSAALAGVVDLGANTTDVITPTLRAAQFLGANGWPTPTLTTFVTTRSLTVAGIPQFTVTATAPIETFFFRILGFDVFDISHSATAAYFAQSELYPPTAFDHGHLRRATQFLFGEDACTQEGDPVMPLFSTPGTANADRFQYDGVFRYRIRIPEEYVETLVRIELFDPDSVNLNLSDSVTFPHSASAKPRLGETGTGQCTDTSGPGDRCILNTNESLTSVFENPFWIMRVDENWDANCAPVPGNGSGNTTTTFDLYYLDDEGDRVPLAEYVNNNSDAANTDLRWVTPTGFEVDATVLPVDPETDNRYLYIDVRGVDGSAKNGWDINARPPDSFYTNNGHPAPAANVNDRNLQRADNSSVYLNQNLTVFSLGRLPIDYLPVNSLVTMPLVVLDLKMGGGTIYVSHFDYDASNPPANMQYTINTVPTALFKLCSIVVASPIPGTTGNCADINQFLQASCADGTDCNNNWARPQYVMGIPAGQQGFFGGILQVTLIPGRDAVTWSANITAGRPFLTE